MTAWTEALEVASAHVDFVVDALTTARDTAQAALTTARADLAAAETARAAAAADAADAWAAVQTLTLERDGLAGQLADAEAALDQAQATLTTTEAQVATLTARVAELETQLAHAIPPSPQQTRTIFGACPGGSGGTSLTAAQTVVNKFGPGVCVRQFLGAWQQPNYPTGATLVHVSYSKSAIPVASVLSGSQDAAIAALAAALTPPPGVTVVLEYMHEADKKVSDGYCTRADAIAAKNRFYDLVRANVPATVADRVLVANTLTGWIFDTRSSAYGTLAEWGQCKADIIGADFDGVHPTVRPYPVFTAAAIARVQQFAADNAARGYRHWAVPEFGAPLIVGDTNGLARAAWILDYGVQFAAAGAKYVAWFDYNTVPGYETTNPAEVNALKALRV